jgi:hypothetical protein
MKRHRRPAPPSIVHRYIQRVRGMGQDSGSIDVGYGTTPTDISTVLTPPTDVLSGLPSGGAIAPVASGSPLDLTNFINALTKGAQSGVQIYNATQTPALIPGTNAIFNPATGQYYNPTTGQVVNPFTGAGIGTATGSLLSSPYILIGGLVIGGVLLASMIGGRR